MAIATVDVIFRFKQLGDNFLKQINTNISSQKTAIDSIAKSAEKMATVLQNSFDAVAGTITKIKSNFDTAFDSAGKQTKNIESNIQGATARTTAFGAVFYKLVDLSGQLGTGMTTNKEILASIGNAGKSTFSIFYGSFQKWTNLYYGWFKDFWSVFSPSGIMKLLTSGKGFFEIIGKVWFTAFKNLGLTVFSIFGNYLIFKDATEFLKRMVGLGNESLTPLGRVARLVTTIDSAVHSTATAWFSLFKGVIFGIGTFTGLWNPILGGLAIAKNLLDPIQKKISMMINETTGRMGSVRGQINVIFFAFRQFLFDLAKGGKSSLLNQMTELFKDKEKLQGFLSQTKSLIATITGLSRLMADIKATLNDISLLLSVITGKVVKATSSASIISNAKGRAILDAGKIKSAVTAIEQPMAAAIQKSFVKSSEVTKGDSWIAKIFQNFKAGFQKIKFGSITNAYDTFINGAIDSYAFVANFALTKAIGVISKSGEALSQKAKQVFNKSRSANPQDKLNLASAFNKLFDYDAIFEKKLTAGSQFTTQARSTVRSFLTALSNAATSEKNYKSSKLLSSLFGISGTIEIPNEQIILLIARINKGLGDELTKAKGGDFGSKFLNILTQSLKGGVSAQTATNVYDAMSRLKFVMIESLSKMDLSKSGQKIPETIGKGIKQGQAVVVKATDVMTKAIDELLPHSNAQRGALSRLTLSGFAIPVTLAQGVKQGQDSLIMAIDTLADTILATLKPAVELKQFADRVALSVKTVSALEYAYADLNIKATDLFYPLSNLNKLLTEPATAEQAVTLQRLGISLNTARQKTEPLLDLWLQFENALSKMPVTAELSRQGFDMLGVMANSNLVNGLRRARTETEGLMKESEKMGGVWQNAFSEQATRISQIWERLRQLKTFVFQDFMAKILPVLEEVSGWIMEFVRLRRGDIQTIAAMVGDLMATLFRSIPKLFAWIRSDSNSALQFVISAVYATSKAIFSIISDIFGVFFTGQLAGIVWFGLGYIGDILWTWVKSGERKFTAYSSVLIGKYFQIFFESIDSLLGNLPKRLQKILGLDELRKAARDFAEGAGTSVDGVIKKEAALTEKILKDLGESARKEFSEIMNRGGQIIDKAKIKQAVNDVKTDIAALGETLKDITKGSPLEDELTALLTRLKENYDKLGTANIAQPIEKLKEAIDKGSSSVEKFNSDLDTQNAQLRERNTILLEIAARSGDDKAKAQLDILNLEKQQINELIKLRKIEKDEAIIAQAEMFQAKERGTKALEAEISAVSKLLNMWAEAAGNMSTAFANMYELSGKKIKEFFYMSKAAAIAEIIVKTAVAAMNAYAQGGPYAGPLLAAMASMAGATQIALVTAQTVQGQGMVDGGVVQGPPGIDKVDARLTAGEYVIPAGPTRSYGTVVMDAIRNKLIPPEWLQSMVGNLPNPVRAMNTVAFNTGGYVPFQAQEKKQEQVINIINVTDTAEIDRHLASYKGNQTFLNLISKNAKAIQRLVRES